MDSAASCVVRKRLETDHDRSYNLPPQRNIQPGSRRFFDGTVHFGLLDRRLGDSPDDSRQVLLRGRTSGRSFEALLPVGAPAAQGAAAQLLPLFCGPCRIAVDDRRRSKSPCDGHQQRLQLWPISNGSARVALVAATGSRRAVRLGCRGRSHLAPAAGPKSLSRRVSPARHALRHWSSPARLALCLGDLNLFAHLLTAFDNVTVVGKSVVPWPIGDCGSRALESSVSAASGDQHLNLVAPLRTDFSVR